MIPPLALDLDLNDPAVTPSWSADITPYLRAWSSSRGTARELTRVEAGTASVTLDNLDGRFTPMSTSSMFYPNLLPMRRMRLRANIGGWGASWGESYGGTVLPIWTMFVESWPAAFPSVGDDQTVTVGLVDGFKVLSLAYVSGSFASQRSDVRVAAILDAVGWPASDRSLSVGIQTLPASTLVNVSALQHLQDVEKAEGGKLYIGRDGKLVFRDRYSAVLSQRSSEWADDGTAMSYRDLVLRFDDSFVINDAHITRDGGVNEQVATSASSIAHYRPRTEVDTLLLNTDNEALDYAGWLVNTYAEPSLRIEQLADNAMKHGQWSQVLSRDLRDRVLVTKTPKGANRLSQDSIIEGIAHEWTPDTWRTTLMVSPSQTAALFTWDVSAWDVDTRWAR